MEWVGTVTYSHPVQHTPTRFLSPLVALLTALFGLSAVAPARAADNGWLAWVGPGGADAESWVRTLANSGSTVYAGTEGNGMFRSVDAGTSWSKFGSLPAEANAVRDIEIAGSDVLIGTSAGVFASTSGGAWQPRGTGAGANKLNRPVQTLLRDGNALLAGVVGGVYRSSDGGTTWLDSSGGLPAETTVWSLDSFTYLPSTVLAATSAGVFRSTNNGSTWVPMSDGIPAGATVLRVMADQTSPTRWFAVTGGDGIFRSTDSGQTWQQVNGGLWNLNVRSIAQYPVAGTVRLVAGTADGVYTSSDNGSNWRPVGNDGLAGKTITWAVAAKPNSPGSLLVGTQGGGVHYRLMSPPVNTVAPVLSDTTPQVGQTITTTYGTWTGTPTVVNRIEWERCSSGAVFCDTIPGADALSYTVTAADQGQYLRSVVRATNAASPPGYDMTAAGNEPSALSSVVSAAPGTLPSGPNPTVTNGFGTPTVGQTLNASVGAWGPGTITGAIYVWWRCNISKSNCTQVQSTVSPTYQLKAADASWYMAVQVRMTNSAGTASSDLSALTSQILPTQVSTVTKPSILGSPALGGTLVRNLGTYSGSYENSFTTWQACDTAAGTGCAALVGVGNVPALKLAPEHLGKFLRVKVEIDVNGFNQAPTTLAEYSALVGPVTDPDAVPVVPPATPPASQAPTPQPTPESTLPVAQQARPQYASGSGAIVGKPRVARKLSIRKGSWVGSPTFSYKWKRNGKVIKGASGLRYRVVRKDRGRRISALIVARNAAGVTKVTLPARRIR